MLNEVTRAYCSRYIACFDCLIVLYTSLTMYCLLTVLSAHSIVLQAMAERDQARALALADRHAVRMMYAHLEC
jgi:hypothetical protein